MNTDETTRTSEANTRAQAQPGKRPGRQCECYHGVPAREGFSGHEFTPFDDTGNWTRDPCQGHGVWRGLWQCGGCPNTHTVLVCAECREAHDADAATGMGAQLMWVKVHA